MKEKMRKNDIILFTLCIGVAFVILFFQYFVFAKPGAKVVITVDGKETGTYLLTEDIQIPISTDWGNNLLVIEDGKAFMGEADCPDHLCVKQKSIFLTGESLICLPHRLIVTVMDAKASSVDSVTF